MSRSKWIKLSTWQCWPEMIQLCSFINSTMFDSKFFIWELKCDNALVGRGIFLVKLFRKADEDGFLFHFANSSLESFVNICECLKCLGRVVKILYDMKNGWHEKQIHDIRRFGKWHLQYHQQKWKVFPQTTWGQPLVSSQDGKWLHY